MIKKYGIILSKSDSGDVIVTIPDFNIRTQGKDIKEAIDIASDAIGNVGIVMLNDNKQLPMPTPISEITKQNSKNIIAFVEVNFDEYAHLLTT